MMVPLADRFVLLIEYFVPTHYSRGKPYCIEEGLSGVQLSIIQMYSMFLESAIGKTLILAFEDLLSHCSVRSSPPGKLLPITFKYSSFPQKQFSNLIN